MLTRPEMTDKGRRVAVGFIEKVLTASSYIDAPEKMDPGMEGFG